MVPEQSSDPIFPSNSTDYEEVFQSVAIGKRANWSVFDLGMLEVPSGKLVVGDPLSYLWNSLPLIKDVPIGRFPVKVLREFDGRRIRNFFLRVYFSQNSVAKWEMAITESQISELADLAPDELLGFDVDAGMAFVCDAQVHQQMIKVLASKGLRNDDASLYEDYFGPLLLENADPANPNDFGEWCNHHVEGTDGNIILASTGLGDGVYISWWGYDENGALASLVIDFE